jgi:ABC-type dipeptide/oligopeptide/nickel transport system ATPase component
MALNPPLLAVAISVDYAGGKRVLQDVAFQIEPGEVLGLVGQSGSGKSTLALAILRLLQLKGGRAHGTIEFGGRDLMRLGERDMRSLRGRRIGLVLQSPLSSLNPALRIGTQLTEAWKVHAQGSTAACREAIGEALASVMLPSEDEFLKRLPSALSVGQAQRVLIAMAILHRPELLIVDEPTSALDAITQAEILSLFDKLNCELGMAVLYISHDLLSVAAICDRVAILHERRILECAATTQILHDPKHPYTRALLNAMPKPLEQPQTVVL